MKRKLTPLQRQYNKQISRINRFLKSAYSRGFSLKAPDVFESEIPKRATRKSIDTLSKLTPARIYAKMEYTLPTGEIVSGTKGMSYIRATAQLKAAKSESDYLNRLGNIYKKYKVVESEIKGEPYEPPERTEIESFSGDEVNEIMYNNFIEEVNYGFPTNLSEMIIDAIEKVAEESSKSAVGNALNLMPYKMQWYLATMPNSDDAINQYCANLIKYLPINEKDMKRLEEEFDGSM